MAPIVLLCIALLATACNDTPKSKADTRSAPPGSAAGMDTYYKQKPKWSECEGGFECATVEVPLDYSKPSGERIKIAMSRLPAEDKSHRVGSLFVNPGGPGGSGVNFVQQVGREFGEKLRKRFDIVGFDPRGVGRSTAIDCLDGPALDRFFGTDTSPDGRPEKAELAAQSRRFAEGCRDKSARLLPHVGTTDAAHDIDVLRAAVGDEKLNYLGLSYGTYLGAHYAEQFPRNARALVFDGAVDPKLSATDLLIEQSKGFETALRAFAADCVTRPECPLGTGDADSAIRKIAQLQRKADRTPLTGPAGRRANEAWVTMGIGTALYDKRYWPMLQAALGQAYAQNDGSLLLQLADQLIERRDGSYSNQMEAYMAVNCVDKPNPPNVAAYGKEVDKASKVAPRFGPWVAWGGLPCVYWPTKIKREPKLPTAAGAGPILVIGTTRDPATPYQWARDLASQLKSGVLLTLNGDGHTAYLQHNPCVSAATENYLINGTPPKPGTRC